MFYKPSRVKDAKKANDPLAVKAVGKLKEITTGYKLTLAGV